MTDIFIENLIITLIAGIIGFALSLVFATIWGGTIFMPSHGCSSLSLTGINLGTLIHWSTLGWAMLFCFFLNLLSAGLPAWQASRTNIVNALSGK